MEEQASFWPWLESLRRSRRVFHSEADFQHSLAMVIAGSDPAARVRLETVPVPGMRLDLLVSRPDLGRHLAVELKYMTTAWTGSDGGEHFELRGQGAQDIRAYDVVKDVSRVERLTARPGWSGIVLVLSNDPAYWSRPSHGRLTNAGAFRIYEDQVLSGTRGWGPRTGDGTSKNRQEALALRGSYPCHWSDYSSLPGTHGTFRLLAFTIGPSALPMTAPTQRRPGQEPHPGPDPGGTSRSVAPHGPPAESAPQQRPAPADAPVVPGDQRFSTGDLREELARFERQLRAAGLKDSSVATYVDRTSRFLRWLDGGYQPRGPAN